MNINININKLTSYDRLCEILKSIDKESNRSIQIKKMELIIPVINFKENSENKFPGFENSCKQYISLPDSLPDYERFHKHRFDEIINKVDECINGNNGELFIQRINNLYDDWSKYHSNKIQLKLKPTH